MTKQTSDKCPHGLPVETEGHSQPMHIWTSHRIMGTTIPEIEPCSELGTVQPREASHLHVGGTFGTM